MYFKRMWAKKVIFFCMSVIDQYIFDCNNLKDYFMRNTEGLIHYTGKRKYRNKFMQISVYLLFVFAIFSNTNHLLNVIHSMLRYRNFVGCYEPRGSETHSLYSRYSQWWQCRRN